jgi:hypothetical protein
MITTPPRTMPPPRTLSHLKAVKPFIAVAVTAAAFCSSANAKPCYDMAVQQYNKSRVYLIAPHNSVKVIQRGKPPISCRYITLDQIDYAFEISCLNGYKYEIGTTPWCLNPGEHNDIRKKCEKAIITAPNGKKSYHTHSQAFQEKSCIPGGGQLQRGTKVYGDKEDVLIVTTQEFRAP